MHVQNRPLRRAPNGSGSPVLSMPSAVSSAMSASREGFPSRGGERTGGEACDAQNLVCGAVLRRLSLCLRGE